jgi:transposase
MGRSDIVATRAVFLDETWVNQNAKQDDGSSGLWVPDGSATKGFIPQSKLIFHSKLKALTDYHGKMNSKVFKMWFTQQFLPYLAPESVIVMDNTSIHSVFTEKVLCTNTRKTDVMAWLSNKHIPHTASQTRVKLLQLVKMNKPSKCYELDTIAIQHGHTVQLPPYYCHYNPTELI